MIERILELLKARPFVPFRMERPSGTVHIIRHPDQMMIVGTLGFVGVPKDDTPGSGPYYADGAIISLPQLTQVETLVPQTPAH